jgi:hypothetical protein
MTSAYLPLFPYDAARSAARAAPAPPGRRSSGGAVIMFQNWSPISLAASFSPWLTCEETHQMRLRRHGPCFGDVQSDAGKGGMPCCGSLFTRSRRL